MSVPGRYFQDVGTGASVVIPARLVALLMPELTPWRRRIRNRNAELDALLRDMAYAATTLARSAYGPGAAPLPDPASRSDEWIDTATAGHLLDINARSVRRAITAKRLEGRKVNGGYLIRRRDVLNYRDNL